MSASRPKVLLVDDEEYVRDSVLEVLAMEGCEVRALAQAPEALPLLEREGFDVLLTDLKMPDKGGLWLLECARGIDPNLPVIVITGAGSIADAVRAMKAGAFDFVQKPVDPEALALLVRRAVEHRRLVAEVGNLRRALSSLRGARVLVGDSAAMRALRAEIEKVAPTEATVLIAGESGTGKELVAEALHGASARRERPLVEVNCAAIPAELFESELFGHRRGAFTGAVEERRGRFQEAEGGTLVLDEVGTLAPALQAKLLRVLETGEYQMVGESRTRVADVRVIAITNEELAERVRAGSFRADLYYRLDVFPIRIPPLRERKEDIPALARHILSTLRGGPKELEDGALGLLAAHDWPGNVRELRNALERASIVAGPGGLIRADLVARTLEPTLSHSSGRTGALRLREELDARERELLRQALARSGGRRREAAELLGIDPRNLAYYLRKHGLADASRTTPSQEERAGPQDP